MPAKKVDPAVRLQRFRGLRAVAEPASKLTAAELAKALGFSWRHVKNMIDADAEFPIEVRGAEGAAWTFDLCAVLDHLIARDTALVALNDERAARMAKLTGAAAVLDDQSRPRLSMDEMRQAANTVVALDKMKRQQGHYVLAEPARRFFQDYHQHFQTEALGVLSRIDPAGQLLPAIRESIETDMRNLLVDLQERQERFLTQYFGSRP